jgi:hypothetical protein
VAAHVADRGVDRNLVAGVRRHEPHVFTDASFDEIGSGGLHRGLSIAYIGSMGDDVHQSTLDIDREHQQAATGRRRNIRDSNDVPTRNRDDAAVVAVRRWIKVLNRNGCRRRPTRCACTHGQRRRHRPTRHVGCDSERRVGSAGQCRCSSRDLTFRNRRRRRFRRWLCRWLRRCGLRRGRCGRCLRRLLRAGHPPHPER